MQVIYGRDEVELDAAEAVEVQAIQGRLKSFMGLPSEAIAVVDGIAVSPAHIAQPNSTVEFRLEQGHKGVGQVWTAEEYCQLFGFTEKDFEKQIREGLKVMQTVNGAVRITETAVDNFISGLNGDGASLAIIASSLKRLADHFVPSPSDIVDTPYIARQLGVTATRIAQMVREGSIPKSCIVAGSGDGRPWKFYRDQIEKWRANRS